MTVQILVQGGDAEQASNRLRADICEIFESGDVHVTTAQPRAEGSRSIAELALVALAIPPAVIGLNDLAGRAKLSNRFRQLSRRASKQREVTGAKILIDPGDGVLIPLEEARTDAIVAALRAIQSRLSSQTKIS
jgi:hypothetical protein